MNGQVLALSGRAGLVFSTYLILTGIARFLVEFIRINPRSFLGMTNAQLGSLCSIIGGMVLLWRVIDQGSISKGN